MAELVPLEFLIIEGFFLGSLAAAFLFKWLGARDVSSEGKVYNSCRAHESPCLEVIDVSTGHSKVYEGKKDEDNDPYFDIPGLPMKLDPSLCTGDCRPRRYGNGLNIWTYATPKDLPMAVDTMLAYNTMNNHRNDKPAFRLLRSIPDNELYSLIRLSKKFLEDAAESMIAKYKINAIVLPGEERFRSDVEDGGHILRSEVKPLMPHDEFIEIIEQMKSFFAGLPIETGFYCMQAAFVSLPYAHASQDTERIKYLIEQKADIKAQNTQKLMQYAFMFCMMMAALGGLVAIVLVLAPK